MVECAQGAACYYDHWQLEKGSQICHGGMVSQRTKDAADPFHQSKCPPADAPTYRLMNAGEIELFTLLLARHPETKRFLIYLDNARYHHAVVLKEWIAAVQQERGVLFDLKYLPAYSPNLNLIERLWKFLRKEALQKWHATFEDMQQAVAEVLDQLERYEEPLASLMTERFHVSPRIETEVVGVVQAA